MQHQDPKSLTEFLLQAKVSDQLHSNLATFNAHMVGASGEDHIETANRLLNDLPDMQHYLRHRDVWNEVQIYIDSVKGMLTTSYESGNKPPHPRKFSSVNELITTIISETLSDMALAVFNAAWDDIFDERGEIKDEICRLLPIEDKRHFRNEKFKWAFFSGYFTNVVCVSSDLENALKNLDQDVDCDLEDLFIFPTCEMTQRYMMFAIDYMSQQFKAGQMHVDKHTKNVFKHVFLNEKDLLNEHAIARFMGEPKPAPKVWTSEFLREKLEEFYQTLSDAELANEAVKGSYFLGHDKRLAEITYPLLAMMSSSMTTDNVRLILTPQQKRIEEFENQLRFRNIELAAFFERLPYKYRVLLVCMEWNFKTQFYRSQKKQTPGLFREAQELWMQLLCMISLPRLRECYERYHASRPCYMQFTELFTRLELLDCGADEDKKKLKQYEIDRLRLGIGLIKDRKLTIAISEREYERLYEQNREVLLSLDATGKQPVYDAMMKAMTAVCDCMFMVKSEDLSDSEYFKRMGDNLNDAFRVFQEFFDTNTRAVVREDDIGREIEDEGEANVAADNWVADVALKELIEAIVLHHFRTLINDIDNIIVLESILSNKPLMRIIGNQVQTKNNLERLVGILKQIRVSQLETSQLDFINPDDITVEEARAIYQHTLASAEYDMQEIKEDIEIAPERRILDECKGQASLLESSASIKESAIKDEYLRLAKRILMMPATLCASASKKPGVSVVQKPEEMPVYAALLKNNVDAFDFELLTQLIISLREASPDDHEAKSKIASAEFMLGCLQVIMMGGLPGEVSRKLIDLLRYHHDLNISLPINLSGCDLSGGQMEFINRSHLILSSVNLNAVKMIRCDFDNVRLTNCLCNKINIAACNFRNALILGEPIEGIDNVCEFTCADLRLVNFSGALIRNTNFNYCVMSDVCFDGAVLADVSFIGVDLNYVSFKNADMKRVQFISFTEMLDKDEWLKYFEIWKSKEISDDIILYNLLSNLKNCKNHTPEQTIELIKLLKEMKLVYSPTQVMFATSFRPAQNEPAASPPAFRKIKPNSNNE